MRDKPILWKLYFRGVLLKTLISNHDLHVGLTKIMLDMNLSKDLVKTMKKQMGGEVSFIRRKEGTKDCYYITFMDSDMKKDKNNNNVFRRYGQVTPWVQVFIAIVMLIFCITMGVLLFMMWYGTI
jgi:hypothetical protein